MVHLKLYDDEPEMASWFVYVEVRLGPITSVSMDTLTADRSNGAGAVLREAMSDFFEVACRKWLPGAVPNAVVEEIADTLVQLARRGLMPHIKFLVFPIGEIIPETIAASSQNGEGKQ